MNKSIEQFRSDCAEIQSKIDKNHERWSLLFSGQKIYGDVYKPHKRLITLSKICPNCNNKLKKEIEFNNLNYFYTLLVCQCGYEYAMKTDKKSMDEVDE